MRITNNMGLPQPFVDAATSDHQYTPHRYSVTSMSKGVRQCILERRHGDEVEQDCADMVWAIFGSAVHRILEDGRETATQLKENKLVVDMGYGFELSGIFDLYDDSTGTVTDYKTASVWKIQFGDFEDWRQQLACYVWMLQAYGFDAHRGQIVALLKDHNIRDARTKEGYPPHPVYIIEWEFTRADMEATQDMLLDRFEALRDAERLPDGELPLCSAKERWHRPDTWAAKKAGAARASRVFDNESEAWEYAEKRGYVVEYRRGENPRCRDYCSVCQFCDYWQDNVREVQ